MRSLIVGNGEVGSALYEVLRNVHEVETKDLQPKRLKGPYDVMHVCLRYSETFLKTVQEYEKLYRPRWVDICSTVPVGTTEKIGGHAVHSTTRGIHPHLVLGMKTFIKHIGGPSASFISSYYRLAGLRTQTHLRAATTELAHLLINASYGINLMLADEMQNLCRQYGVDYTEAVMGYAKTNNEGYEALDQKSKCRLILTPPNGRIGGHCVKLASELIPENLRTPLIAALAKF